MLKPARFGLAAVLAVEQLDPDFASFLRMLLHPVRLVRVCATKAAMHRFVAGAAASTGTQDPDDRRAGG